MTPTLFGRLQTRIVLLATLGAAWTLVITLALPGVEIPGAYEVTFRALAVVIVVGLVWELLYHGLQQFRWEKDWPTIFGFVTGLNEGLVAWFVLNAILPDRLDITASQFAIHFGTTWVVVWLFANGPMRVVAPRWRYRGGRIV